MSKTFWMFSSAACTVVGAAPWGTQSYLHSWVDALYFGAAVFCGLKSLSIALQQGN